MFNIVTKRDRTKIMNAFRGEMGMQPILTEEDIQQLNELRCTVGPAKQKVLNAIKTSRNKLHIDFCERLIKQFEKRYGHVAENEVLDLKAGLLRRADELCIYI
jgi:hypothetical protein